MIFDCISSGNLNEWPYMALNKLKNLNEKFALEIDENLKKK